ncbi:MAG: carboxylating nicotinate-nucleotide diphosphorylase [Micrococcales bacterium]|nr:carboxylating nicotinate-nucleotide diphosphorylase [Micrococcales bacterium]
MSTGPVPDLDPHEFPEHEARAIVVGALNEDLGGSPGHDVTTEATIPPPQTSRAQIVARADGVVAGLETIEFTFTEVASRLQEQSPTVHLLVHDGERVSAGDVLAEVEGSTQVILIGERTLLNIISRLSGIATHTRRWADELEGSGAMVLDTRKTTPLLRVLEKYAVRAGGGTNKRMGLFDVAMIKDNHKLAAGSITAAYDAVKARFPEVDVQVEVTTTEEAIEAIEAGARFIMCDNIDPDLLRATVEAIRATGEEVEIEATGGLTLERARDFAETGVDFLSVGGLTHSSPILDIALDLAE